MKARRGTRHWDYGEAFDPTREKKDIDPTRVFDLAKEQEQFSKAVLPHLEAVYHSFGEGTSEALGTAWNLRDPAVAADILERDNRLRGTVETTWQKVQEAIIDGEAEGEGIDGIAKRIGSVFTGAKGYRARMIARTETIGASNSASLQAAVSSGVVGKKTWLAASDHRTRPSHVSADGQVVDLDKPFKVGGASMKHPGDPAGGAKETVNCRCSMTFVRTAEAEIPEEDGFLDEETSAQRATRVEAAIRAAKRDGLETHKAYKPLHAPDDRGFYTGDRLRQQEDIIEEMLAKAAAVPTDGKAVFSGGLGGAGKGTVLRSDLVDFDPGDFLTIDPDAIKEAMAARGMMPVVKGFEDLSPMEMAALVHEESSQIAARLAARAMADRKNVIFDITMNSERSVLSRLERLRAAGYDDVEMVFVDIDVETSVTRALARWEDGLAAWRRGDGYGGRYVPPEIIRSHADEVWGSTNRAAFEAVKDQADRWTLVNNMDTPFIAERGVREAIEEAVEEALQGFTRTGVALSERMPEGLTKDAAAAWFKTKWGKAIVRQVDRVPDSTAMGGFRRSAPYWKEVDRAFGFETLSKATQEEMLRLLDELFSRAPAVADRIPYLGTMAWLKKTKGPDGLRLLYKSGRGVRGVASRRRFLGFGSGSLDELRETAQAMKITEWWSTGDVRHVYAHEFGHHVHYTVEEALDAFDGDQGALGREILDPAYREARLEEGTAQGLTTTATRTRDWVKANLSTYGSSNAYETAAEAWAEYALMGDEARPFAKAVGRRMLEILDRMEAPA